MQKDIDRAPTCAHGIVRDVKQGRRSPVGASANSMEGAMRFPQEWALRVREQLH